MHIVVTPASAKSMSTMARPTAQTLCTVDPATLIATALNTVGQGDASTIMDNYAGPVRKCVVPMTIVARALRRRGWLDEGCRSGFRLYDCVGAAVICDLVRKRIEGFRAVLFIQAKIYIHGIRALLLYICRSAL